MNKPKLVLFLCTGNYYRSRYAEEVFNHRAGLEGLDWVSFSRAVAETLSPENVGPISRHALEALNANGITSAGAARHPVLCTVDDFARAELVIALKDAEHRPMVERRFAGVAHRVQYWDVDDIDYLDPPTALARIVEQVGLLIESLKRAR
ncbi:low molecular weight phosphatase family protein [Bradyrhizobium diazoefficiens]|jgi:protein-tyrosine phosphatase|nr:low molecular weight phosphatase family protein [Bradyrhizobium diazoefficiens]MBR0966129.1 low molecular weight phosphatase family protein [Bradyrhizobium diazoefficiens]MBR0979599.1 low molecular weight phosphatase family protein [Bradyrhizobium diazoefficiens]MBR1008947.1 low molecular weight phosphatase family protein [Bradyrhizobium diazoefficiens]MBR1015395.1 low molecular weight phosphatase family protein [Bradyrhizobium diazoefficiens]MBR1053067.1 low molecular weight phosphatase fa